MQWIVLALGLTFPGVLSLLDCVNREPQESEGDVADRKKWPKWLALADPECVRSASAMASSLATSTAWSAGTALCDGRDGRGGGTCRSRQQTG